QHTLSTHFPYTTLFRSAQIKVSADVKQAIIATEERSYTLKEKEHAAAKTELEAKKIQHKYIPTLSATGGIAHFKNDGVLDLAPVNLPILPIQLFDGSQAASMKGNVVGGGLMAKRSEERRVGKECRYRR